MAALQKKLPDPVEPPVVVDERQEEFDEKRDYLNYDPLKPRPRFGNYPRRKRVLPLKHWAGEQAIYNVRGGKRIPEVKTYGVDLEVIHYGK